MLNPRGSSLSNMMFDREVGERGAAEKSVAVAPVVDARIGETEAHVHRQRCRLSELHVRAFAEVSPVSVQVHGERAGDAEYRAARADAVEAQNL